MNFEVNRRFEKDLKSLPQVVEKIVGVFLIELEQAKTLWDIHDCIPLQGTKNIYRARRGTYRMLLMLYVKDNVVYLLRILSRGQAYKKQNI
jgi:mRNA-degrading endonuclease RelE of RelBE toxin-antitoxin system